MHGIKRTIIESRQALDDEEIKKITHYQNLVAEFLSASDMDQVMHASRCLLLVNPENYSAWNRRKRNLMQQFQLSMAEPKVDALVKDELNLILTAIKTNPKSYSAWYHRRWFLSLLAKEHRDLFDNGVIDIEHELALTAKLLDYDSRNYHCWGYRKFLLDSPLFSQNRCMKTSSFCMDREFTRQKLSQCMSNGSAYHRRAVCISRLLKLRECCEKKHGDITHTELDYCRNAYWTDIDDEPIWLYFRWTLERMIKNEIFNRCSDDNNSLSLFICPACKSCQSSNPRIKIKDLFTCDQLVEGEHEIGESQKKEMIQPILENLKELIKVVKDDLSIKTPLHLLYANTAWVTMKMSQGDGHASDYYKQCALHDPLNRSIYWAKRLQKLT